MAVNNYGLGSDFTYIPIDVLFLFQDPVQIPCCIQSQHLLCLLRSLTSLCSFFVFPDLTLLQSSVQGFCRQPLNLCVADVFSRLLFWQDARQVICSS